MYKKHWNLNFLSPEDIFPCVHPQMDFNQRKIISPERRPSYLLSVLLEDLQRPRGPGSIPELQGAVATTGDQHMLIVLTPGHIKQTVIPVKATPGKVKPKNLVT